MSSPSQKCKKASPVDVSSTTSKTKNTVKTAWPARKFVYPKQSHFCYTREDLYEEYGLRLEGKLYQNLDAEDLTKEEWLSVFTKGREKGSKLFLSMVRPKFMEECRLLFHKAADLGTIAYNGSGWCYAAQMSRPWQVQGYIIIIPCELCRLPLLWFGNSQTSKV